EVNIGTGTMDRRFWSPVVDRFIEDLADFDFNGRALDVRENVKFRGGHFGSWIHRTFAQQVCALSIEFKKTFMDEWTGDVDMSLVAKLTAALRSTVPGVQAELERM
ncbi:MAG: N-formylglutamate amidohydrolase, partial [Planctomycetaceae bacterium]